PVEWADEDGVLAVGGDLEAETLRTAYRGGIFPWPIEGLPLLWFAPPQRAVLHFEDFHVSRRLARWLRSTPFEVRINCNFEQVIEACAKAKRKGERGTWITPEMRAGYLRLHQAGIAHSVETYLNDELVGGLYGVSFGAYFAGESMFHRASGASKAALVHLVSHLQRRDAQWLDAEVMTPLFESFGAREVPRAEFMRMLKKALNQRVQMFDQVNI
ncbi:MAG TPA: leucyl/phenylalanyl-tRNA--protein transferase, partial [Abditibacteriaceae bacterium]|nr:leucyl/phenylalanyl-tRNA--protein transferase [Abditibacteriaceae bacterium]